MISNTGKEKVETSKLQLQRFRSMSGSLWNMIFFYFYKGFLWGWQEVLLAIFSRRDLYFRHS